MKEYLHQNSQEDIVEKLMQEVSHHIQISDRSSLQDATRLIATDVLVEIIEKETDKDGRTVIRQLADKIKNENYDDDLLAALDMAKEALGDEFYSVIPDKVNNYFAERPRFVK